MKFERIRRHHVAGLFGAPERARFKNASPPQPAPASQVAGAQTQSNIDTAIANATLGNVNQSSPFGSTTYQQTGTVNVDGRDVPQYSQTTTLNPTLQRILSGTQDTAASLLPTGQTLANQASTSLTTPLNFSGVNNDIIQGGPQTLDQNAAKAIYGGEMSLLQPTFDQQQRDLEDQLSRQGIGIGSDAYNRATTNLNASQAGERNAALGTATGQGIQSANNMFGLALQGQQQNVAQQQLAQTNPLNNLRLMYSGTV